MCCWGGPGKQDGWKLNGTQNLLVCADGINLMREHNNTMQRNTESLLNTGGSGSESRGILSIGHMFISHHQNEGQSHSRGKTYRSFVHVFIYLFLTAIGLTPGGSSTVHIHIQTVHRIQRTELT
jgi:hypothetical protein